MVGRLQPILAQLPRTIADAVVSGSGREGLERASVANAIERRAQEAEAGGFDLDAVLDGELTLPDRPLAPREYGLLAPGMSERLRVTTDPAWYEEHAESVELWSPGNPLFSAPEFMAVSEELPEQETLADFLEPRSR